MPSVVAARASSARCRRGTGCTRPRCAPSSSSTRTVASSSAEASVTTRRHAVLHSSQSRAAVITSRPRWRASSSRCPTSTSGCCSRRCSSRPCCRPSCCSSSWWSSRSEVAPVAPTATMPAVAASEVATAPPTIIVRTRPERRVLRRRVSSWSMVCVLAGVVECGVGSGAAGVALGGPTAAGSGELVTGGGAGCWVGWACWVCVTGCRL